MATNPLAAAAARKSKAPRPATPKKAAPKDKAKTGLHIVRSDYDYKCIAKMYNDGKTAAEISDACGLKPSPGSKPVSKYSRIANILTRLSKGVKVGDETIRIKRG